MKRNRPQVYPEEAYLYDPKPSPRNSATPEILVTAPVEARSRTGSNGERYNAIPTTEAGPSRPLGILETRSLSGGQLGHEFRISRETALRSHPENGTPEEQWPLRSGMSPQASPNPQMNPNPQGISNGMDRIDAVRQAWGWNKFGTENVGR